MKKILFLITILVLSLLAVYLVFFRGKSTLGSDRSQFSLHDKNRVSEIRIQSGKQELDIYKLGNDWFVESEKVDKQRIADLLMLNENLEIISPAPLSSIDSISACLDAGKTIHFLSGNKTLLAYDLCAFERQIFARKIGGSRIFRVASRGFSGVDLSQLLSTQKNFWMGNILISLKPDEIRLIHIQYFPDSSRNFALFSEGEKIALKGSEKEIDTPDIDIAFVNDYLRFFSGIKFEKPKNEKTLLEELRPNMAFFSLQILSASGQETKLAGFRIPGENPSEINPYIFCALTVDRECILLNYSDFDPILVDLQDFLKN